MPQRPVEVILAKQLAGHLATPVFLVDPEGSLLFYNEPAEGLLGHRFEETGEMPVEAWAAAFQPTDEDGNPLPSHELPLVMALEKKQAAHRAIRIRGMDGVERRISITAFPLEGGNGRNLGAMAIFWEDEDT